MRKIDHIVYCVHDLEAAVERLHTQLGVKPAIGGRHWGEGTMNALVNLGEECYLEILAIDAENKSFTGNHWMGLDLLRGDKVTRWALKTDVPHEDSQRLKKYNEEMGKIKGGSRELADGRSLEWDLVMPLAEPEVELVPFMTDWSKSTKHPTDSLEGGCKLIGLEFYHTNPDSVRPLLEYYLGYIDLKKGDRIALYVNIQSPKGIIKL